MRATNYWFLPCCCWVQRLSILGKRLCDTCHHFSAHGERESDIMSAVIPAEATKAFKIYMYFLHNHQTTTLVIGQAVGQRLIGCNVQCWLIISDKLGPKCYSDFNFMGIIMCYRAKYMSFVQMSWFVVFVCCCRWGCKKWKKHLNVSTACITTPSWDGWNHFILPEPPYKVEHITFWAVF